MVFLCKPFNTSQNLSKLNTFETFGKVGIVNRVRSRRKNPKRVNDRDIDILKAKTAATSVMADNNYTDVKLNLKSRKYSSFFTRFLNNRTKIFNFVSRFACEL